MRITEVILECIASVFYVFMQKFGGMLSTYTKKQNKPIGRDNKCFSLLYR